MAIPYHNPDTLERVRLESILERAAKDWSVARQKCLSAQQALARAEQRFDRAAKQLDRFLNPDLFDAGR